MNNMRRLFGATTGTTTTAIEAPYASYDPSTNTTWTPQLSSASSFSSPNTPTRNQRPTRTPSPPPLPKLATDQPLPNASRLPSRQNSAPLSPGDDRAPSRRTNSVNSVNSQSTRSGGSKKHRPGHSKALSSFSRKLANGVGSTSLANPPVVTKPKDELIIELMASEAVVDSRDCEILGAEQIEELKKELNTLSGRVTAATKKVALATKLRDAALSLQKVQSASNNRTDSNNGSGPSVSPALEAADVKVQNAQIELSKLVERYNDIQRQLLEHRSAVLSYSLGRLEAMLKPQEENHDGSSGRTTPANQGGNMNTYGGELSPTSASNMSGPPRQKFEGAHFFAGHANSKLPYNAKSMKSTAQITAMEEQLASVEKALKASKEEEEALRREAEHLRQENVLATQGLNRKVQEADHTISGLRAELQRMNSTSKKVRELEDEKRQWEEERFRLQRSLQEREFEGDARIELDKKETEIRKLRDMLEQERQDHADERNAWEDRKLDDMERLRQEMEDEHAKETANSRSADVELDMASERLQALIKTQGITLSASQRRDMNLLSLINATSTHLDTVKDDLRMWELEKDEWELSRRRMESDLKSSLERRERLSQELEDTRRESEAARREIKSLEERLKIAQDRPIPSKSSSIGSDAGSSNGSRNSSEEMDRVMTTLRSLWGLLPSREARTAAKSNGRSASPTSPLRPSVSRLGEPPSPSLSDLDVRALKALYDPRNNATSPLFSQLSNPADFSIDAFAQRVQALVADDRAIIERLLRFAQAHDLLKNNAARAQKLAQESSMGLETYQKQVKSLEDRNATLVMKQNDLIDEINNLQALMENVQRDKRQLDLRVAEQKVEIQNMNDANAVLSARTLALAEEAATAPESMRIKMESAMNDLRRQLKESMEEAEALRGSEQGQKAALLEELNLVQGENSKLRDQLRAEIRKQGK